MKFDNKVFFENCKNGIISEVKKSLDINPKAVNIKSKEGWTPIIVAAFWQRYSIVKLLLDYGANPNDTGKNGTSVLMYSKTKIIETGSNKYDLLELLIKAGAKIDHKDKYNKDIFFYISNETYAKKNIRKFLLYNLQIN